MALLTNDNYTKQKIKIKTDRLELRSFFSELIHSLGIVNQSKGLKEEFIKRELLSILNKLHKKLNDPNLKDIKAFSFNYYEAKTIQEISHFTREEPHFFDVVFWKIDGQIRELGG
jgi:hypothetical protein